jgi:hypothetical protein
MDRRPNRAGPARGRPRGLRSAIRVGGQGAPDRKGADLGPRHAIRPGRATHWRSIEAC